MAGEDSVGELRYEHLLELVVRPRAGEGGD